MTVIPRRTFTGALVGALAFSRFTLLAQSPASDDTGVAASSDASRHLTIPVEVDGRGPFRFVIDTGADSSVIADTTVEALGLRQTGTAMLAGIVRTVRTQTAAVGSISFGPISRRGLTLPVLPRSQLLADGYIGLDLLDGYRVILDFAQRRLIVTDPVHSNITPFHDPSVTVLHAQGSSGHLRSARCWVDRVPVAAFIDTGAESSMGNEALYRSLLSISPRYASTRTIDLIGLTGGSATGRVIAVHEAKIGGISVIECPIAIADLQVFDIWGLADRPALVIGMNWLRQFNRVEVDYGRKDLRFQVGRSRFVGVV